MVFGGVWMVRKSAIYLGKKSPLGLDACFVVCVTLSILKARISGRGSLECVCV